MCLILTAYKLHPTYDLIILANRDEFYERPTQSAHWWNDGTDILAGKDLKAGGTWLGVNKANQFSALTNYRDPASFRPDALSRGPLVSNFLKEQGSVCQFGSRYLQNPEEYNDFNLLLYDDRVLYYFNSLEQEVEELDAGLYGLSNHKINTPWPKVIKGLDRLEHLIAEDDFSVDMGFDALSDQSLARDEELPETGIGIEKERFLSAMHIDVPGYGTRSSNVVLFHKNGEIEFHEKDHLKSEAQAFSFTANVVGK